MLFDLSTGTWLSRTLFCTLTCLLFNSVWELTNNRKSLESCLQLCVSSMSQIPNARMTVPLLMIAIKCIKSRSQERTNVLLRSGALALKTFFGAHSRNRGTIWNFLKASDLNACRASLSLWNCTMATVLVSGSINLAIGPNFWNDSCSKVSNFRLTWLKNCKHLWYQSCSHPLHHASLGNFLKVRKKE